MKSTVAFFDFDGTLTRRDSMFPFLRQVSGTPFFIAKMAYLSPILAAYFIKVIRNDVAKEIVLASFLNGIDMDVLQQTGTKYAAEQLPSMLRTEGIERLRWHQSKGHACVLVSASLDIYLAPWALAAGFDDWITSSLEIDSAGAALGRLRDGNCFGDKKAKRIRTWLLNNKYEYLYAYGDTRGDLPMLELADEGYMLVGGKFSLLKTKNKIATQI